MLVVALASACFGHPATTGASSADEAGPDPFVALCEGMLQHVVRERPTPQIHLLWGWRADVVFTEHTGSDQGTRHVVSLDYDATTTPATADMPVRDRMTCEYPPDAGWWLGGKRARKEPACSSMVGRLLPDRITANGEEIRYDDRQGRAKIEAWAEEAKEDVCGYRWRGAWPPAGRGVWAAKDAHRACRPMLASVGTETAWAPPGCEALHMCANEAQLDDDETAKLYELIEDAGCEPP